jgi:hypothetical protein
MKKKDYVPQNDEKLTFSFVLSISGCTFVHGKKTKKNDSIMSNRKKQPKAKEPVKIRFKQLSNGNQSVYPDYYRDGKREYEFLKLYPIPETGKTDREANAETLRLANAVKSQTFNVSCCTAHKRYPAFEFGSTY